MQYSHHLRFRRISLIVNGSEAESAFLAIIPSALVMLIVWFTLPTSMLLIHAKIKQLSLRNRKI